MSATSPARVSAGTLTRIVVTANDSRLDVGIPADMPFVDLIPGFARALGVLTPELSAGGFTLVKADGTRIDPASTPLAERVIDGDRFSLVIEANAQVAKVYDDIVEAVGDAVESQYSPWTNSDSARTAIAAASAFLIAGAALLLRFGSHSTTSAAIAGAIVVIVVTAAAVITRLGQETAGQALVLAASVYGAVGGYLATPVDLDPWGWPMATAGAGAAVVGFIGLAALGAKREIALLPASAGLVLAIAGTIIAAFELPPSEVLTVTLALCGTLTNGLPWLALSTTGIAVITPNSDSEILTDVPAINGPDIAKRYGSGQRLLTALRLGLCIVIVVATVPVATSGVMGVILCAVCYVGMMLSTRQTFVRSDVLIIMATGIVGLVLTGAVAAMANPSWRGPLIGVLSVASAAIVALTMLSPRRHLRLDRVADAVDLTALATLLPLGVIAAGLV